MALENLSLAGLENRIGESFQARTGEGESMDLELMEVVGIRSDTDREDPFSAIFKGPAGQPHPQQIFNVEHDELGSFVLFLVPIGPDEEERQRYEAVFN